MNRMFRRACGAFLSCVCVVWHGRLDAAGVVSSRECQPYYNNNQWHAQNIGIERGANEWYVGYATTGVWMGESRSRFTKCIKMSDSHDFKVCSIGTLGSNITTQGTTFERRCLFPYNFDSTLQFGTGTAIPFSCMTKSGDSKVLYASTPKIFQDYGCTSGFIGGPNVPCLYAVSQSGVANLTFYPNGQSPSGSTSGSGTSTSDDSLTGVTVPSMSVPYIKYTFKGCYTNGYWDTTYYSLPSSGANFVWHAHPSKINYNGGTTDESSLEAVANTIYNGCYSPGHFAVENTNHVLDGSGSSATVISSGSAVLYCTYCPSGSSDLANKSTLFGSNTATLNVKEQANRVGVESCSLNNAMGKDSNNKGTVRYTNCTSYSR